MSNPDTGMPKGPFLDFPGHRLDIPPKPIPPSDFFIPPIAPLLSGLVIIGLGIFHLAGTFLPAPEPMASQEQRILCFSDIHLAPFYIARSNTSTWCHKEDPSSLNEFTFGQYGCDTPSALFMSLVRALPKTVSPPTAIVIAGDNLGGVPHYTMDHISKNFESIRGNLSEVFPRAAILPVMGNNEFVPNYGTWETDAGSFVGIARVWSTLLRESELQTVVKGGYYFRDFVRLRVVVLNTVMYQLGRAVGKEQDPYGQFEWLDQICDSAVRNGMEIHVFFHVPPSVNVRNRPETQGWHEVYVDQFAQIYAKYQFAMTCGHLHTAALVPLFNKAGKADGHIMSLPGVSLRHEGNPGFRVIHHRDGKPINLVDYFADISAQAAGHVEWRVAYSFKKLYETRDLSQRELARLADRIAHNSSLMWKYHRHMDLGHFQWKIFHDCFLTAVTTEEFRQCVVAAPDGTKSKYLSNHTYPYL
jgi:hypothetical protein